MQVKETEWADAGAFEMCRQIEARLREKQRGGGLKLTATHRDNGFIFI